MRPFWAATIGRFAEQYQRFVDVAITDLDTPVAEVPMTGDDDLLQLLALGGVWDE